MPTKDFYSYDRQRGDTKLHHLAGPRMWILACVCGLTLLMCAFWPVLADVVDDLQRQSGGRLSDEGADYLRRNWVAHSEPCRKVSDVGGWFWGVTYGDRFEVFNCFRKCRGTEEVAKYFLGISDGDCDSFSQDGSGRRSQVCFPRDAGALVERHGAVIAISRRNECRE